MFIRFLFLFLVSSVFLFSKEKEDPWVLLVKQCGKEKIMVRFPEDPEFNFFQNEMRLHFYSKDDDAEHHLRVEERNEREKEEVFRQVMSRIENSKELALVESKNENSIKKIYFDIKVEVLNEGYYESRTLLTKHHIYTLETHYPLGQESHHKNFVESFHLIS